MALVLAEWIEDSALAGAPITSYAANQQETYRDPQTGPTVPNAMGQKRKFTSPPNLGMKFHLKNNYL